MNPQTEYELPKKVFDFDDSTNKYNTSKEFTETMGKIIPILVKLSVKNKKVFKAIEFGV